MSISVEDLKLLIEWCRSNDVCLEEMKDALFVLQNTTNEEGRK